MESNLSKPQTTSLSQIPVGHRKSTTTASNSHKILSTANSNNSSISSFDGLAKFMLRSRSFLMRPSRSSSNPISAGGGGGTTLNNTNQNPTRSKSSNEQSSSNLFGRRRISFPLNSNNTDEGGFTTR